MDKKYYYIYHPNFKAISLVIARFKKKYEDNILKISYGLTTRIDLKPVENLQGVFIFITNKRERKNPMSLDDFCKHYNLYEDKTSEVVDEDVETVEE